jgi:molybdate transport system substrate-binding protein
LEHAVKHLSGLAFAVALVMLGAPAAYAQTEITFAVPSRIREPIQKLIERYENKTGDKVKATYGNDAAIKKQVVAGDPFDVTVIEPPYAEVLASGHLRAESETPLASVSLGLAVQPGTPRPDISTLAALKKTLLDAKSMSYPGGTGAAGLRFEQALKTIGLFDELKPKIKRAQGGAGVVENVRKGEAEIGVTFMSELLRPEATGIDVIGPLPTDFSQPALMVGFVSSKAKSPASAMALLEALSSPEAATIYRANGMQPGR